jgi:hypothetical protein
VSAGYSPASRAALSDAAGATCSFAADTSVATPSGEQAIASLHIGDSIQARPDPTARRLPVKAALPASLPRSEPPLVHADLDGSLPLVRSSGSRAWWSSPRQPGDPLAVFRRGYCTNVERRR